MNKRDLLKKIELLNDDTEINFLVFDLDGAYNFHRLEASVQWKNDPPDVIAFIVNRFIPPTKTAREVSELQKAVNELFTELGKRIDKSS